MEKLHNLPKDAGLASAIERMQPGQAGSGPI